MDNRYVNYDTPRNYYGQGGYVTQTQQGHQQQNSHIQYGLQSQQLPGFRANPPYPYRPPLPSSPHYAQPPIHPMVAIPQPQPISHRPVSHQPIHYPSTLHSPHYNQWQYHQQSPQLPAQQFYQQPMPSPIPPPVRSHPVVEVPNPPQHSRQYEQKTKVVSIPSTSSPAAASTPRAKPPPTQPEVQINYQALLLSLAEEYINAAHSMGSLVASLRRPADADQYYKLLATGLGCMEVVLKRFRLSPRAEASLIVHYVSMLYEETTNFTEMESLLTKGITICERNRMFDLKYTMHHLQTRILFKTNPRAALKSLDTVISNADAYSHIPWIYALRFLRVFLTMQLVNPHHDIHAAVQHLRAVTELAKKQGDSAIRVTSSTCEALMHIFSGTVESIEQANHALASARSLQLDTNLSSIPQIWSLLDCVDLACSLLRYSHEEAKDKMSTMQKLLDELYDKAAWAEDGSFSIPLGCNHDRSLTATASGIFKRDKNGNDFLLLQWLSKRDLYVVGYVMSSIATQLRNANDSKAQNYLLEGLKMMKENFKASSLETQSIMPAKSSLASATARIQWRLKMECHLRLLLTFIYCNQANWSAARKCLDILKAAIQRFEESTNTDRFSRWSTYLEAVIAQGTGDVDKALSLFQSPLFTIPDVPPNRIPTAQQDLAILASLNALLIIRSPTHPSHHFAGPMLAALEPLALNHPNKSLQSATYLLKTLLEDPATSKIIKQKQSLQQALSLARKVSNQQLLTLSMNLMTSLFFKDIVGDQATKSFHAGWVLAKRCEASGAASASASASGGEAEDGKGGLWTAVAGSMWAETLEKQGTGGKAEELRREARDILERLPDGVRDRFVVEEGG